MLVEAVLAALLVGAAGFALYYLLAFSGEEPKPKFKTSSSPRSSNEKKKGGNRKKKRGGKSGGGIAKKSNFSKSITGTKTKGGKHKLLVGILHGHTEMCRDVAWSPNGKIVVSIDGVGHVHAFSNIKISGNVISSTQSTMTNLQGASRALCMPTDDMVIVGLCSKRVAFVKLKKGKDKKIEFEKVKEAEVQSSFDIQKFVCGNHPSLQTIIFFHDEGNDYLEAMNMAGESYGRLKIKQGQINDIVLSPGARILAVNTSSQCNVFVVKPGLHCCLQKVSGTKLVRPGTDLNNKGARSCGFTPSCHRVVVAGNDQKLMTYTADINWMKNESAKLLNEITIENMPKKHDVDRVLAIDNDTVAVGIGPLLRFYDITTGKMITEIPNATKFLQNRLFGMYWNSEFEMMLTAGNDKRVSVWKGPSS